MKKSMYENKNNLGGTTPPTKENNEKTQNKKSICNQFFKKFFLNLITNRL